jgi:flagellar basal-body rod modification protein FlgD
MSKKCLRIALIAGIFISSHLFALPTSSLPIDFTNNKFANASFDNPEYSQWILSLLLLGKRVEIMSKTSSLYGDLGLMGSVFLPPLASEVTVTISDMKDNILKKLELGEFKTAGIIDFKWDGIDLSGAPNKPDSYKMSATATVNGKQITVQTGGVFVVSSVAVSPSGPIINLDGVVGAVSLSQLVKVL